jgi:hypothetical protein
MARTRYVKVLIGSGAAPGNLMGCVVVGQYASEGMAYLLVERPEAVKRARKAKPATTKAPQAPQPQAVANG